MKRFQTTKVVAPDPGADTDVSIKLTVTAGQRIRLAAMCCTAENTDAVQNMEPMLTINDGDSADYQVALQGLTPGVVATVSASRGVAPIVNQLSPSSAGNCGLPDIWWDKTITVSLVETQPGTYQFTNFRLWYELDDGKP